MRPSERLRAFTRPVVAVSVIVLVLAATANGAMSSAQKLSIGAAVAVPAQPAAGKTFSVSFSARSGSGALPATTRATFVATIGGQAIKNKGSFKSGKARDTLLVPADAGGRQLKLKVTIRANGETASRVASFRVKAAAIPTLRVADASVTEGSSGVTTLSFPVTLSVASTQIVSVTYSTADGSAVTPSDYATATGTLTFQPGETSQTIPVNIVPDLTIEPDETLTVTLSNPKNASLAGASATGTITNDDVAVPVTAGSYKGATQEGNYVFFSVQGDRTLTAFRANDLTENCDPPDIYLPGGVSWGTRSFPIANDGSFTAQGSWSGSQVNGDVEWLSETWSVTGTFTSATAVSGKISLADVLNYKGRRYSCSSSVTYTATLQS